MSEAVESQLHSTAFYHHSLNGIHRGGARMTASTELGNCRALTGQGAISHLRSLAFLAIGLALLLSGLPSPALAQQASPRSGSDVHYFLNANQAPGVVAGAQVARQNPGIGTFTAVSISGPDRLKIALARDGQFLEPIDAPVVTGFLVGAVYRFRVTNIPLRPGEELYPTVEIIDKVTPPVGREHRFPIPIVLTEEDLRTALEGALVTRVIYVEDSENADPHAIQPGEQPTLDVGPEDNALKAADQLGRPLAILRIGSRVPMNLHGDLSGFLYGCPPWVPLPVAPNRERMVQQGLWGEMEPMQRNDQPFSERPDEDYPRTPSAN